MQTGSGKTHTMWGPPGGLLEKRSLSTERGLMPRVFEQLFSRISQVGESVLVTPVLVFFVEPEH